MKRFGWVVFISGLVLIAGCRPWPISLRRGGADIKIVTAKDRDKNCSIIDVVNTSFSKGATVEIDMQSAMNKAKNKVAALGGDSMYIMSAGTTGTSMGITSSASTVMAQALKCRK